MSSLSITLMPLLTYYSKGYEVLLLNEPLDDVLLTNVRRWKKVPFQDVAKAGLKFGDEGISMPRLTYKAHSNQ